MSSKIVLAALIGLACLLPASASAYHPSVVWPQPRGIAMHWPTTTVDSAPAGWPETRSWYNPALAGQYRYVKLYDYANYDSTWRNTTLPNVLETVRLATGGRVRFTVVGHFTPIRAEQDMGGGCTYYAAEEILQKIPYGSVALMRGGYGNNTVASGNQQQWIDSDKDCVLDSGELQYIVKDVPASYYGGDSYQRDTHSAKCAVGTADPHAYTAKHELGHCIGLGHRHFLYDNSLSGYPYYCDGPSVMCADYEVGQFDAHDKDEYGHLYAHHDAGTPTPQPTYHHSDDIGDGFPGWIFEGYFTW